MKVLVADDDVSIRLVLKKKLEDWGYDVFLASDGDEAIDILKEDDCPRIAIIDWKMPNVNGGDVCKEFKDDFKLIYFIIMTSMNTEVDLINAIDKGAHNFLSKPISFPILKRYIDVGQRLVNTEDTFMAYEKSVRIKCYGALADLSESRNEETGEHMKRLDEYARVLSKNLNLSDCFINDISTFSSLHDIGKVAISDKILLAPRKLTDEEFTSMKTHTTIGYDILKDVPTMEMAAKIANFHHEKWNGTGYPLGLKEEEIPLEARIVALADVYDALRSNRPYKKKWSHKQTYDLIMSESGEHFDPKITEAFSKINLEFDDIFKKNN